MNDIERQIKIEADAIHDAKLHYAKSRKFQSATDSRPVRDLMMECLNTLSDAILAEQVFLKSVQSQKLPKYATALLSVGHEQQTLITLGTLFNAISRSEYEDGLAPAVTTVAYEIGQRCRIERFHDCFRHREVDLASELFSRNRSRHAWRRAEELARKSDDEEDWAKNYRSFHLGQKLIGLAVRFAQFDGQPVFELATVRESDAEGTTTTQRIALTTAAADMIARHPSVLAFFPSPAYQPMRVPPRPWTSLSDGAYYATPMKLVKRQASRQSQQRLAKADLSIVRSAVNAMQNTPFRINKAVFRVMRPAWDAGLPFFKLPDDADGSNLNIRIKGHKKVVTLVLGLAEQLLDEERFYYPHQLDHRGRAYPVPQLINPQSNDTGRSLLEFADGKPLGERGPYWLAIQLANFYWKENKGSFDERLAWVKQNEKDIIAFAADPLGSHRFWHEADKRWLFFAASLEWKGYREQGPDFISHLPVSVDGSCNGYQHLSAMARDPAGGRATNLVPAGSPQDIYQKVIDLGNSRIKRDAETKCPDQEQARALIGKLKRSNGKHATMTTPYGVTRRTIYKKLLETEPAKSCKDPKKAAMYLAKVLEECIAQVAIEAGNIMYWLRDTAREVAKANRGIAWTTPVGFPVEHAIRVPKKVRLATADKTFVIYHEDEKRKIDPRKQADGIVAHFVHSHDAAHMMKTVIRLDSEGIRHVAMVHDSYGVHACDIDRLNLVLREEFVAIHSERVLVKFLKEQMKAHPDLSLPALPAAGDLDIRQVLSSPYFFA
jgi:Autographiviridae RNA polymerase